MTHDELNKMVNDYQWHKANYIARTCADNVTFCGLTDYVSKEVQDELLDLMDKIYHHAYSQALNDCIKIDED